MKKVLLIIAACAFVMAGCVKEEIDPCPATGRVDVLLYVEQFGGPQVTRAAEYPNEDNFGSRIKMMHYYLYLEDKLVEHGELTDAASVTGPYYTFTRSNLEFGNYKLAVCANCDGIEVRDLPAKPELIALDFKGVDETDDYFMTLVGFTVDCDCTTIVSSQLKRLQGLVRYAFSDIPENVTEIEFGMDGLCSNGVIVGTYSRDYSYTKRIPVTVTRAGTRAMEPTEVWTFPTMEGRNSSWSVKLLDADGNTIYENPSITGDIAVVRNRLLDLGASFTNGNVQFFVNIDPEWEDPVDGGSSEVE